MQKDKPLTMTRGDLARLIFYANTVIADLEEANRTGKKSHKHSARDLQKARVEMNELWKALSGPGGENWQFAPPRTAAEGDEPD